jgi:uncharacterized protein YbjQ (UPF0145 family)/DNA-directed RNA polymerase subunit RPC12/RpoP
MLLSMSDNIEGYKVVEYKKIVFGSATSGEGIGYRQSAIEKAWQNAENVNANAIINLRVDIYPINDTLQEATAYGHAVDVLPLEGYIPTEGTSTQARKVDVHSFLPKVPVQKSEIAELQEANGYKFVACPRCGTKYKTDVDEKGEVHIKGFEDVDDEEDGLQIYCLRCGTKFTVPGTK